MLNVYLTILYYYVEKKGKRKIWNKLKKMINFDVDELNIDKLDDFIDDFNVEKLHTIKPSLFKLCANLVAKELKKDKWELYEKIGKYFAYFLMEKIPEKMIILGSNIFEFLNNFFETINSVYRHFRDITNHSPVYFICYKVSDNHYKAKFNCNELFYQSIFLGFINECNWLLFNQSIKCSIIKPWDEIHKTFTVNIQLRNLSSSINQVFVSTVNDFLDKDFLEKAVPCYILFNSEGTILELGDLLKTKFTHVINHSTIKVYNIIDIVYPQLKFETMNDIKTYENLSLILKIRADLHEIYAVASASYHSNSQWFHTNFLIKGQIFSVENNTKYWFVGYPHFNEINQLYDDGFFLSDVPIQNGGRDVLMLLNSIKIESSYSKKLHLLMEKLDDIKNDLAMECIKTEDIINELYPSEFALKLISGSSINAVNFSEIVILCSDIVNFTSISSFCTPIQIVSLLKVIFGKFDDICHECCLTKIETSGDGYMIASGIQHTDNKFSRIVNCALQMIATISTLDTDISTSVKIRIGIFSGPVIAGIVGLRSPRFCLFGKTVSYASKLEQTAPANKIHISKDVYKHVKRNKHIKIIKCFNSNKKKLSDATFDPLDVTYVIEAKNAYSSKKKPIIYS